MQKLVHYQNRQLTTKAALEAFSKLADEVVEAESEREKLGLSEYAHKAKQPGFGVSASSRPLSLAYLSDQLSDQAIDGFRGLYKLRSCTSVDLIGSGNSYDLSISLRQR